MHLSEAIAIDGMSYQLRQCNVVCGNGGSLCSEHPKVRGSGVRGAWEGRARGEHAPPTRACLVPSSTGSSKQRSRKGLLLLLPGSERRRAERVVMLPSCMACYWRPLRGGGGGEEGRSHASHCASFK